MFDDDHRRQLIIGINFSPSIKIDPFPVLAGEEESFGALLEELYASPEDPVAVFVHLVSPAVKFIDRGKTAVNLQSDEAAVAVRSVVAAWSKQKKSEIRSSLAESRRLDAMTKERKVTFKEAAAGIMVEAYMKASTDNTLPANPRQIMYAARPHILAKAGKDQLDGQYFAQTLLVDYVNEHPEECADWNIAWDDRGHMTEPHTGHQIGLGTLAVREYIDECAPMLLTPAVVRKAAVETHGPNGRFGALLYIEKEGFVPLFAATRLAERYDIAIMSSKGMSVAAARELADAICAEYNIPLLILHDFDRSGMSIAKTLHTSNRRYTFKSKIKPIYLGVRLADVAGLESEPAPVPEDREAAIKTLRENGATQAEIEFLMSGRRVELNAMTSGQFIEFVERKLRQARIRKIVPDAKTLADTYRMLVEGREIERIVEEALKARVDSRGLEAVCEHRARAVYRGCSKEKLKMGWRTDCQIEKDDAEAMEGPIVPEAWGFFLGEQPILAWRIGSNCVLPVTCLGTKGSQCYVICPDGKVRWNSWSYGSDAPDYESVAEYREAMKKEREPVPVDLDLDDPTAIPF